MGIRLKEPGKEAGFVLKDETPPEKPPTEEEIWERYSGLRTRSRRTATRERMDRDKVLDRARSLEIMDELLENDDFLPPLLLEAVRERHLQEKEETTDK